MPRDLPGLYWDEDKNRYFSLSSRPNPPPKKIPSVDFPSHGYGQPSLSTSRNRNDTSDVPVKRKRRTGLSNWKASCSRSTRESATHNTLCSHYACTTRTDCTTLPVYGRISAFCTTSLNGQTRSFSGDNKGWLYSYMADEGAPETTLESNTERWTAEVNLEATSEISSISISGPRCVATSFGASSKIFFQNLDEPGRQFILSPKSSVHDVRTSHLLNNTLILGADRKAVYLHDIEDATLHFLDTQSDVFAVHQQKNLVYAGARNSSINRFDMRIPDTKSDRLIPGRPFSPVVHLEVIREWQLLVSHMNGDLGTFDLRFPRGNPLMSFHGHVNSVMYNLGITVDPSETFLFAAGDDRHIRGWSLQTGAPLQPPLAFNTSNNISVGHNPFLIRYEAPPTSIQVTEERDGLCMWVGADRSLYKFHLGQDGHRRVNYKYQ